MKNRSRGTAFTSTKHTLISLFRLQEAQEPCLSIESPAKTVQSLIHVFTGYTGKCRKSCALALYVCAYAAKHVLKQNTYMLWNKTTWCENVFLCFQSVTVSKTCVSVFKQNTLHTCFVKTQLFKIKTPVFCQNTNTCFQSVTRRCFLTCLDSKHPLLQCSEQRDPDEIAQTHMLSWALS